MYTNIIFGTDDTDFFSKSSIFRTFQGWLALTETGPTQGTLKVFPDVLLSNSYMILRPFFRFVESAESSENPLDPKNWEFGKPSPYSTIVMLMAQLFK